MGASIVQMPLVVPKAKKQYFFIKPGRVLSFAQRFVQEPEFDHSIIFNGAMMRYQFPKLEGELFIAEPALIYQMLNENIYICKDAAVFAEYQPNGLSARAYLHSLANFGRFWWYSTSHGKKTGVPKSLAQWLVIPFT